MTPSPLPTARRLFALAGIALLTACGGGSGDGDGTGGPCEPESDATLCTRASLECGAASALDRCGTSRVLDCGGCEDPLWCGGGGEPNRCGATCPVGCPDGWTCELGVCQGGDRAAIALDLETVAVEGTVRLNGARPTASAECYDHTTVVSFRETTTGASASTLVPCDSADFAFRTELAPGTYAVSVYKYRPDDSNLPDGTFVVEPALVVDGDRSDVVLDVRTVAVSGRLTLAGAAPVAALDCYDYSTVIHFTEALTGSSGSALIPCDAADFAFDLQVPPGTYAVTVSKYRDDDSNLPDGSFVVAPALAVNGDLTGLVLDVSTVGVSGRLTWNGAIPEASVDCYDHTTVVYFRETSTGTSVSTLVPCEAEDFAFGLAVPPGTYGVTVSKYRDDDSNLPDGTFVVAPELRIDQATAGLVLDLRTVHVAGRVRWNGATPRASEDCYDHTTVVSFVTAAGGSASALVPCDSADFAFELDVSPGTHTVSVYKYRAEDSNLPDGTFVAERALRIDEPTDGLVVGFETVAVGGTLTVNGRTPTVAQDCYDYTTVVSFRGSRIPRTWQEALLPDTSISTTIPCSRRDFSWSLQAPPGDYVISVYAYRVGDSSLPDGTFAAVNRLAVR